MHTWILGTVVHGDGRGRQLGFPTANLVLASSANLLREGVYACWAQILPQKTVYAATLHVGPRPTFDDPTLTVEVHILDFPDRDLYDERFAVLPVQHLRDIAAFANAQKLIDALRRDSEAARRFLRDAPHPYRS